jgi:single-strand DNA-binding protein
MADINHVVLVGRLTRDAELKYTNSGMAVCKFAVAVNRRKKDGDAWVEEANFFDVVLWGKSGEAINQYLTKGKQVGVEGELRQDRWEQEGQNRSKVEIFASNVQLLGGPSGAGGGGNYNGGGSAERSSPAPRRTETPRPSGKANDAPVSDDFNDDIPF